MDEHYSYQDVASVMAVTNCYSTAEPHVDAACDIYVQKIGPQYRVYMYVNCVRLSLFGIHLYDETVSHRRLGKTGKSELIQSCDSVA